MQFLKISNNTVLDDISDTVGTRNISNVLALNGLVREKYIGKQFKQKCDNIISMSPTVDWKRQASILNKFISDYDAYEEAAIQSQSGWKILSNLGTFPNALVIPETITLPYSAEIIGGGNTVPKNIYEKSMRSLYDPPHYIDPSIFESYNNINPIKAIQETNTYTDIFQMFKIPWGKITLYDSISNESIDFPVYPESVSDSRSASYSTMQDMLYQYEPWQIYSGSGPRTQSYAFHFHRQMWTGNELDGKANELIRFCEACLYPEYKGSAVNTSTVRLYVEGSTLISGILSDVIVTWDGPIGRDGWYLNCNMEITITEVATRALNHDVVKNFNLIQ